MTKTLLFVLPAIASLSMGCGGTDAAIQPRDDHEPRPAMLLSLAVEELDARDSSTGTAWIRNPAPEEGAEIALASTEMSLSLPPVIVVAPGEQTATFAFTNHYDGQPKEIQIIAGNGEAIARAKLYVPSVPFDVPACSSHGCVK